MDGLVIVTGWITRLNGLVVVKKQIGRLVDGLTVAKGRTRPSSRRVAKGRIRSFRALVNGQTKPSSRRPLAKRWIGRLVDGSQTDRS